jgi:SAM-dependent methyltransferase
MSSDLLTAHDQNIAFYNEIANEYDQIMDQQDSNRIVRGKVAATFMDRVKGGLVLDFGGGTGQDMKWLSDHGYRIIFCEPSSGMREKAIHFKEKNLNDRDILFLDDTKTDFTTWNRQLPFPEKADAILSNFAALNCIRDLHLLFANLSLVLKPGGQMFALILDEGYSAKGFRRIQQRIRTFLLRRPLNLSVRYKHCRQAAYIHPEALVKRSISDWFELRSTESFPGSGFKLIHLVKK